MKSNISTEIASKSDLTTILLNIHKEVEREKKAMTVGLSTGDFEKDEDAGREKPAAKDDKKDYSKKIYNSRIELEIILVCSH